MRLILAIKRDLVFATAYVPSLVDLQKSIPEMQIISDKESAKVVEIPSAKVVDLQRLASQFYHIETDIVHHTSGS
jgi:hypothetical protein